MLLRHFSRLISTLSLLLLPHLGITALDDSSYQPGKYYLELNGQRMVVYQGLIEECQVFGDSSSLTSFNQSESFILVNKKSMSKLINFCQEIHKNLLDHKGWEFEDEDSNDLLERRKYTKTDNSIWSYNFLENVLIFPGTKWCGKGSVAETYHDLGVHEATDSCCRSHDFCSTSNGIFPGDCKHGLCNLSTVTRSSCSCDAAFARCLQLTRTKIGSTVGKIFFNFAGLTCFKYDNPIKRCNELIDVTQSRLPLWILQALRINPQPMSPRCRNYELDMSKEKEWQYFETVYEEDGFRQERMERTDGRRSSSENLDPNFANLTFFQRIVSTYLVNFFQNSIV